MDSSIYNWQYLQTDIAKGASATNTQLNCSLDGMRNRLDVDDGYRLQSVIQYLDDVLRQVDMQQQQQQQEQQQQQQRSKKAEEFLRIRPQRENRCRGK